ncbi:MAG: TIGR03960 family B12-binding radical SAM protein [Dehalococcoidia bacterium]|nr:MAG: TIGR03960 family B12-binding radical SAM protein [Dehalococcoidia bacterium]
MTNLDQILPRVTRPARYTGGEWNSITKDWDAIDVKIALAYPDIYEIGMSNLGLVILYDLVNREPKALVERVYAPWVDMEAEMRKATIPLFSLESRRPLKDFDIIGFSLGYELTYTNVLNMLDLAGIPVLAAQRDESYPLIIAGGSCSLNAEPMAEFIDLFVLGEGEEVILELLGTFRRWKFEGSHAKQELLRELAHIPGIYVPSLYQVDYHNDGTIAKIMPTSQGLGSSVKRRILIKLPPAVTKPVVPYMATIHDRAAIEIQRGCTRGCRFCQAGIIYRPIRERPKEEVLAAVDELLRNCGYNELSLLSLSTSDYSEIESLVGVLSARYREHNIKISLPSLRIDGLSLRLMDTITSGKKTGLTFAPEAGSERLRRVINKSVSQDDLLQTLETAAERGWNSVKLYFMLGLPTETLDDIESIVHMVRQGVPALRKGGGKALHLKVSTSAFVPKAHTPFQWVAQHTEEELNARIEALRLGMKKSGLRLSWQDPKMSLLEGVLARGDRRLSQAIYRAWQLGATFDAWSEHFNYEKWGRAFDECGLDPAFYANRQRPLDEIFPWAHIDVGISTTFLKREYQHNLQGTETPDCRFGRCTTCGLERWHPACQKSYQNSSSSS